MCLFVANLMFIDLNKSLELEVLLVRVSYVKMFKSQQSLFHTSVFSCHMLGESAESKPTEQRV